MRITKKYLDDVGKEDLENLVKIKKRNAEIRKRNMEIKKRNETRKL